MILRMGRFWMRPLPFWVTVGAAFFLFFYCSMSLYFCHTSLKEKMARVQAVTEKAAKSLALRKQNQAHYALYQGTDPLFLEKHLASFSFLSSERALLEEALSPTIFPQNAAIAEAKRIFRKTNLFYQKRPLAKEKEAQEILFVQKEPVYGSFSDITHLLSVVEGAKYLAKRPEILFTRLQIDCHEGDFFPYFTIQTELLQRDFPGGTP